MIGAVLVPGAKAPRLVTDELVSRMKPGAVLVDISIDQGGCFEGSRPTTHADPTYRVHDALYYCVANMPGAVPHTSTYALTNVTLPYVVEMANRGWRDALRADASLARGLSTHAGQLTSEPVAEAHALPYTPAQPGPQLSQAPVPSTLAALTLADAVRGYLQYLVVERGLAANTVESYRRDLRRYSSVLADRGKTALGDVTPADVAEFLASLREGDAEHAALAVSSAARAVIAVRGLHAFAVAQGLADTDPAREIPPPSPPRSAAQGDHPGGSGMPAGRVRPRPDEPGPGGTDPRLLRDRALLEFLYGTGARISEATGLDIDELQLGEDPVVRLVGKGSKHRVVPVGSYAVRALQAYLVRARPALAAASRRVSVSPAVFLNARGGRLTRQGAWGVLHAAAARAGLDPVPGVSPHTLRHSFATHLLDGGADIRVVQELLGHASVTTTQVYTLITVDRLREVYASSHPRALG